MRPSPQAQQRHPHLKDPQRPGWVRVDLHSHTMWSGDSTTTPAEIADAVEAAGIDVLCITDHNAVAGAQRLSEELGCRVVVGEELRTTAGEVIGLFLTERVPMGMTPLQTARAIRDQGALVYIPHPFDPMRRNLSETALLELTHAGMVDAIEVLNSKTSLPSLNQRAADFAKTYGLRAGAGSDAHVPLAIGAAYVEMPDFDGPDSFLAALEQGKIIGHHWDEPRPWTPRIIPSVSAADPMARGVTSPEA
jgi:predicted metal-dependent phosphoesterase TrpH